jgi:sugar phosphate isomerase/epimerase
MQRCFSSLGCPEYSLDAVLDLADKHAIPGVELRSLGGTLDLPAYLATHFATPAALALRLRKAPVQIVALDTSLKLTGSAEAQWLTTADAFLPWAEALGGVKLRVFDGGQTGSPEEIAAMAARFAWWQALRRARGWKSDVVVETHDSLFTAAAVLRLVAAAPGVSILWDSHHTWKRGGEDPVATWRALRPHIGHIHVKDSVSHPSPKHPYSYVLPGEGEFPAAPLMAVLKAEYPGDLSLEWEKLWHPYLPLLEDALVSANGRGWW